jgi:hypothetical protein
MLSFHHVSSLMNDHDQIEISHIVSLNSMFFDLLALRVSVVQSSCHVSFQMDGSNGFGASLMHFSPDPMTVGPCAKFDGSDLFSSSTLFKLFGHGFQQSRSSPMLDPTAVGASAQI